MEPEAAAAEMLRGHLDVLGAVHRGGLAQATGLGVSDVSLALVRLETEGFALRGRFTDPDAGDEEWCARRVLTRIHAYTRQRKRREVEPVTAQDFMRFLLRWQHVTPEGRREGSRGVLAVVEQLQGFELAAGAWEKAVLRPGSPATARNGWTRCAWTAGWSCGAAVAALRGFRDFRDFRGFCDFRGLPGLPRRKGCPAGG